MRAKYLRFKQYMEYKGLYDNKVARDCNIAQGIFYQAKKGKSDLGEKTLEKIFNKYKDLNRIWILTGEGSMLLQEQEKECKQNISAKNISGDISNTNTNYHNNYYSNKNNGDDKTETKFLEILHEQLKEKDKQIAEKDKQIAEKDKQMAEKDWQIRQIMTLNTENKDYPAILNCPTR